MWRLAQPPPPVAGQFRQVLVMGIRLSKKAPGPCLVACLPLEVLEMVFRLLPPRDLKAVVRVCRRWRKVGELPCLWTWVYPYLRGTNMGCLIHMMAEGRRLSFIQRIVVSFPVAHKGLVDYIISIPTLKEVDLSFTKMTKVDAKLLASLVQKLEHVGLRGTELLLQQVHFLLIRLSQDPKKLKTLILEEIDLSSVDPELLSSAVRKLESVSLQSTKLNTVQIETVLTEMSHEDNLKELNLSYNNLGLVDEELLARSTFCLCSLYLCETNLFSHQLSFILRQESNTLKLLQIDLENIVDPTTLKTAKQKFLVEQVSKSERKNRLMDYGRYNRLLRDYCF